MCGAQGLPVSLSGFLENQLLQRQIGNSATETGVLTLKLLQTPGLVNLQAAILPTPSKADIEMTKEVRDAGAKLGIVLHDHLIMTQAGHASFKEMGLL